MLLARRMWTRTELSQARSISFLNKLMAKRDTSILSWKSNNVPGRTLVKRLIGLGILLFLPAANLSCGNERGEQPKTGPTNSSPTITSVRILPENPTKDSEVSLIIQSMDPDGNLISYKYQWI